MQQRTSRLCTGLPHTDGCQAHMPVSPVACVLMQKSMCCSHIQGTVPEHIRAAAQRSTTAAQLRSAHEAAVSADKAADATTLAAYMAYIQVGK